jgi:hypothetical protein
MDTVLSETKDYYMKCTDIIIVEFYSTLVAIDAT